MKNLILIATLMAPCAARAQGLYMPRAVKHAYERGTRAPDGKPGKAYWQNRARYTVSVTALPPVKS